MDLELTVLQRATSGLGYITGLAIGDDLIACAGGTSAHAPTVLLSSNARHFEPRKTPRQLGLRDIVIAGDALWTTGEYGQLAVSRDRGESWKLFDTGTDVCLFALALAPDGAVWVVGDAGYVARVYDERLERIDFKTKTRLAAIYCIRDEAIALGCDGVMYRWRAGVVTTVATGATKPLTALAITKHGSWLVIGDGGFVARSPDGGWFSRAKSGVDVDLEAITSLGDGRIVMVGDRGTVLLSADDGRTWITVETGGMAHLWAVERFGSGVVIGGDEGLLLKLAPAGDRTWDDRTNVFGRTQPLDAVFEAGPDGFIGKLPTYVSLVEATPAPAGPLPNADAFARIYGVPLPADVQALFVAARGRDCFEELRLDATLIGDAGEANLFERLLGGGLTDAFCGTFCIGSQVNGDTYHVELYEWDGPRQVLHFDRESQQLSGVVADSVESLVYLAALVRANETRQISSHVLGQGLHALRGRVAPTWHFEIEELDPEFIPLDAKRRDAEFFFYRARWICALLENEDIGDIESLFMSDFNQIVPADQLEARFDACEKVIPTALYSMWRAFFFEEPELPRYLEIGRRHAARIVRDAARLVDELLAGRNTLGAITDMRARLAAFRALDLDPRRTNQRTAEAVARAETEVRRTLEVEAELDAAPRETWAELAWSWLDDGIGHRALLAKLAEAPELADQIEMLDELRGLPHDERAVVIDRLAGTLAPELEAILVGSLVRGDDLADVLEAPVEDDAADEEEDDEEAVGWDAIDTALAPIYGGAEPHAHVGTIIPYMLGGNDPLHGISVYLREEPVPHFHFVTYGFTDLFEKETQDPEVSGFGFELTLRLARAAGATQVPPWPLHFLQNLARYVFGTGNRFGVGHKMGLNGPIAADHDTALTAILLAEDPELGDIDSPHGHARFLQVVGITDDEYKLIQEWSTAGLVDILRRKLPMLVTDLARPSVLTDPDVAREVRTRVDADGSSEEVTFAGDLTFDVDAEHVRIELGALYAAALPRAMRGRLRHGRTYVLRGHNAALMLAPAPEPHAHVNDGDLTLSLSPAVIAEIENALADARAGTYRFTTWPSLEIVVTPTIIRDPAGTPVDVRGVADPDEVKRLLASETPPAAKPASSAEARALAALAMTERALQLAPDDDDTQFTHAMLLIDANRLDTLLDAFSRYTPSNRINVAVRMAQRETPRFADAVAIVAATPDAYDDVPDPQRVELAEAVLAHTPEALATVIPLLPADVTALATLAWKAIEAEQRDAAIAIYERLLELPIPDAGEERTNYLRALNNACVQAHAAKAYDMAVRIADRAQPVAHENPYIYHSAACAYAAVGAYAKAFEQVKHAVAHDYDHLGKVEIDSDLGPLLEWPEFKALFRDWHARKEGN